jgi:hypothetical protein
VIYLDNRGLRTFDQGLDQCIRELHEERLAQRAAVRAAKSDGRQASAQTAGMPGSGSGGTETGERIRNPMMFERLEAEIFALEAELASVRADMERPENYANHENMQTLQERETGLAAELATAYERWEHWE